MKFKRQIITVLLLLIVVACGSAPASQHDMDITTADANTGVTFRAAINAALQALASTSTGATAPATTYANQFWADTTANKLKIRNTANTAWITLFDLGTSLTATTAELNKLAGTPSGLTSTEIGYLDGTTSAIQTQLDGKFSAAGGTIDGDTHVAGIFSVGSDFVITPGESFFFLSSLRLNGLRLQTLGVVAPASATADGTKGDIQMDANYIYICVATNTWKRVAISTW